MRSEIHNPKSGGFTLIELVMVIVLLGILAVFVAPRLPNITATNAGVFAAKLRADIRYSQDLAMTRNLRSRLYFNGTGGGAPASGYAVASSATSSCTAFSPAANPATGKPFTVDLTAASYSGSGITLTLPVITCLEYNSIGTPYDCTGLVSGCSVTAISSSMTVTINAGAAIAGAVVISSQTGAVN